MPRAPVASVRNAPVKFHDIFVNVACGVHGIKDTDALIKEVKEKISAQPWRFFRIGTWELGDSLALEPETGQAAELIREFAQLPNAVLELKTKSDKVDTLLDVEHKGRTVISWSLNPASIVDKEEHKTASLKNRLSAMKKVADAGYLIGAHFDPMIYSPTWQADYKELITQFFDHVTPEKIAWISIGSLRFNPEQKRLMAIHFPGSKLQHVEMIKGPDNKIRYVKPIRTQMYRQLITDINAHCTTKPWIYLCMERWDMWETLFGHSPDSTGHLDFLFAEEMKSHFPHLNVPAPDRSLYEKYQNT